MAGRLFRERMDCRTFLLALALWALDGAPVAAGANAYKHLPGFEVPTQFWTNHDFHPVGYLKTYPVASEDVLLTPVQRRALANLFRAAHYACRFKYRQGYPLPTDAPLYRLLRRQYPGVEALQGGSAHAILSDWLTDFLESPGAEPDGPSAVAWQAQAPAPAYNRADRVRIQTADGKPASPEIQRVIAVPGDRLKIDASRATVNGQAIDLPPKVLATCGKWSQDVPAGHYVLVGEEVKHRSAARSCSLLPASRIAGLVKQ